MNSTLCCPVFCTDRSRSLVCSLPFLPLCAQLELIFKKFGNITDMLVIRDKVTGQHKGAWHLCFSCWCARSDSCSFAEKYILSTRAGCAFITFENRAQAEAAIVNVHDKIIIAGVRSAPLTLGWSYVFLIFPLLSCALLVWCWRDLCFEIRVNR